MPGDSLKPIYTCADRTLAVAMSARAGLQQTIDLAEAFKPPCPDEATDDLLSRLRTCVELLDAEIESYRGLTGRGVEDAGRELAPLLRLVQPSSAPH